MRKILIAFAAALALTLGMTACREKTTSEKVHDSVKSAGQAVDDAAKATGKAVEDATK